jgi:hypothetical protein
MGPNDSRFADIAIRRGLVSFEKLRELVESLGPGANGEEGRLAKLLVEKGMISQVQHEEILKAREEPDPAPEHETNDARFCEALIRRGMLSFGQLYEVSRLREKYRRGTNYLKSLDDILIEMGYVTARQVRQIRGANSLPRVVLPERTHSKIGELALRRGYITEEQLMDCLNAQAEQMRAKDVPPRLGEILLAKGYIEAEQLDELLVAHGEESQALKITGYEIQSKIGAGGMGEIYKARQISVDRIVAIKVLSPLYAKDKEYMERFIREAKLLAKLDHPYIVKAIDAGQSRNTLFYVMEYVDGATVLKLLKQKGRLPERDCLKIGIYVGHALEHAAKHKLVHRDVKPTNIMITKDGVVKLCDLGIAKLLGASATESDLTKKGYAVGSPYYIAPETCLGRDVDIRSDIYSLGATLYHCVTGKPPFDGPTAAAVLAQHVHKDPVPPKELCPEMSQAFSDAILGMMQKVPEERPQSPEEVAVQIESIMKGGTRRSKAARRAPSEVATARREPTVIYKTRVSWGAVAAAVILTMLICSALAAYFLHGAGALKLPFLK